MGHNGSSAPYMNGNGYLGHGLAHHLDDSTHEMDRFLPHSHHTTLSENEHSDSKVWVQLTGKQN